MNTAIISDPGLILDGETDGLDTKPPPSYARDLRVVGQLLERREVSSADLVCVADAYVIRGIQKSTHNSRADAFAHRLMTRIDRILRGDFRRCLRSEVVDLRYDLAEIVKFDYLARRKRSTVSPMPAPDPYSVSHILRSAGAYLDGRKNSLLIGISLQERWVTIRFETAEGHAEESKQSIEYFYDYWVKMYLRRGGQAEKSGRINSRRHSVMVK